jgi:hypothetical protein
VLRLLGVDANVPFDGRPLVEAFRSGEPAGISALSRGSQVIECGKTNETQRLVFEEVEHTRYLCELRRDTRH